MLHTIKYLRAAVLDGAAEGGEVAVRSHKCSRAKVNKLHFEMLIDNDVLILDITMENVQAMQV